MLALALFAGVRPEECDRLSWKAIHDADEYGAQMKEAKRLARLAIEASGAPLRSAWDVLHEFFGMRRLQASRKR